MNSGVKGAATRVSIPIGVKKMIDNIKEITGNNHSEDEIYATLKECGMDPNETTDKLLLLDTFHEVKRRRDRRKEAPNKDPADLKWKPGTQARSNRVGRANYMGRYTPQDAGGGRSSSVLKENVSSDLPDKATSKVMSDGFLEMKKDGISPAESQSVCLSNLELDMTSHHVGVVHEKTPSSGESDHLSNKTASPGVPDDLVPPSSSGGPSKIFDSVDSKGAKGNEMLQLGNIGGSLPSFSASGTYLSSSHSQGMLIPNIVGAAQHDLVRKHAPSQLLDDNVSESKSSSNNTAFAESTTSKFLRDIQTDSLGIGKTQQSESLHSLSSLGIPTVSRPSSSYNNRSQVIVQQKVGTVKEWKPKSSHPNSGAIVVSNAISESSDAPIGRHPESRATSTPISSKEATLELPRKLECVNFSDSQHVVIPNHLQVHDIKKLGFCFGSFDAGFELDMNKSGTEGDDRNLAVLSESSDRNDESLKELQFSGENAMLMAEDADRKYSGLPQSPVRGSQKFSAGEGDSSTLISSEQTEPRLEAAPENHLNTLVHASSSYNLGFMPPIVGSQVTPLETLESQARDVNRLPGFIVPQSFDPASYYAQIYHSGYMDNDGRISPFRAAGAANKYNSNTTLASSQTAQTPPEGNIQVVLSTASPTLMTQAAGVMQSSIPATQQPVPMFRQPAGVHLPHYPPNYIPYGPYFSPFYVPPPAIHQFLGTGFPQQPPTGGLYPSAPGTSSKYSMSQLKQGSNTGSSMHVGLPGSYGPYGLPVNSYTSSSISPPVTSSSSDDASIPQVKENNVYLSGQQNEGPGVWFTTPTGDISSLPASTFYNLSQGGQLAFSPAQAGHGTFTSIFHPAQGVTAPNIHPVLQQSQAITSHAEMVGQTPNIYQQPQPNWPNNY